PEGVVLLRRLEQPVDRGLATALRVPLDVVVPEAARPRLAEVVPQVGHAKDLAGFLLDGVAPVHPDHFENLTDPPHDFVVVIGVIDEDAVPVNTDWVFLRCLIDRKAIGRRKPSWGTRWQRRERVGRLVGTFCTNCEPNIPVSKRASKQIADNRASVKFYG